MSGGGGVFRGRRAGRCGALYRTQKACQDSVRSLRRVHSGRDTGSFGNMLECWNGIRKTLNMAGGQHVRDRAPAPSPAPRWAVAINLQCTPSRKTSVLLAITGHLSGQREASR
eukprot:5163881-Prymnesium_polylepis.2